MYLVLFVSLFSAMLYTHDIRPDTHRTQVFFSLAGGRCPRCWSFSVCSVMQVDPCRFWSLGFTISHKWKAMLTMMLWCLLWEMRCHFWLKFWWQSINFEPFKGRQAITLFFCLIFLNPPCICCHSRCFNHFSCNMKMKPELKQKWSERGIVLFCR